MRYFWPFVVATLSHEHQLMEYLPTYPKASRQRTNHATMSRFLETKLEVHFPFAPLPKVDLLAV